MLSNDCWNSYPEKIPTRADQVGGLDVLVTHDPRNLISDIYAMETISKSECRTVFLDWVLGLPEDADVQNYMKMFHDQYSSTHPDHPMTEIFREGIEQKNRRRARKGRGN